MKSILALLLLLLSAPTFAQVIQRDVRYLDDGHARHVLDIYAPENAKNLPVVFWMHGGGWQQGDKSSVQTKPKWFLERGFVFVSTNYRLLPEVDMGTLIRDCAKSFGWVQKHIAEHGGDPKRVLVGGHSAGAQLAAILCTDDRYLKEVGADFSSLIGCVPVDGDTYNVPAIIEVAETRARVHGFPLPSFGHRLKFGNDPALHKDFSAVTHVAKGRGIPPFLILHVSHHPDNTAQARHFGDKLKAAEVPVTLFGARDTEHVKLNSDLGLASDPATKALDAFVASILKK
ncbi:MAG: alpha/beta hydrolase [Prosthecobacter sp.]|jgi:arylformamidase|uniref:alpha/beta hydrolase n=1 Tax=Prosthecobacter sp. TaxID=1965333 RepID=UPI001A09F468|nr:alpha/beta hydrolase [Prosthecobacter sp.]MBE2285018.1 alpha/beta hydrolase [Prosthecobacter sp.]